MAASVVRLLKKQSYMTFYCVCCRNYRIRTGSVFKESPTDIANLKPVLKKRLKGEIPEFTKNPKPFSNKSKFNRQLFGRFGFASGVDPAKLWPNEEEIKIEMAKLELQEPLHIRLAKMREGKANEQQELEAHQKLVASRMAKMEQYIEQYNARKSKKAAEQLERRKRKEALLDEAHEFFGYEVTEKDGKFQQMMEWKEEQEAKERKMRKKQFKQNYLVSKIAKLTAEYSDKQEPSK